MSLFSRIFKTQGIDPSAVLREHAKEVSAINSLEEKTKGLTDAELADKTREFKARLKSGETRDSLLPEAFAVVRETARRTLKQRHYDVQLIGGMILHARGIAEMKTGEGKTLVATLAAYLNALDGGGVHIVTVNDYLSKRDAAWMGQIYEFLGLSVAVINHGASFMYDSRVPDTLDEERDRTGTYHIVSDFLRPCERKEAYMADITYGTNSEFGFDYLRDNLAYNKEQLVQREFTYCIIDEIDSILIDEARTPLIVSAPIGEKESLYPAFAKIAARMQEEKDYTKDEKLKAITLTDSGIEKAQRALGIDNIYTEKGIKYVHHLETAVRAKALYLRDREYVLKSGEVVIVDPFTGRLQPGRRWSEGLHQAIEAKEGVQIKEESRTMASITYQNYFRMYKKLSGMTGTAVTSQEEFEKVYGLSTVVIPTNRPSQRIDSNDQIFQTEVGKFKAIARKIKELNEKGQPVLVGTISVDKNELLSGFLRKEGVTHNILNAKKHEEEGEVIAGAGAYKAVTIATNMAGRGIDIKLGGKEATPDESSHIKNLGGLFVLGTERHEARRIDNQLRGRSGRQGDPGETQFFVSLEDSLMQVFGSDKIKNMMGRFGVPEDEPIQNKFVSRAIESAQEKIEGFNFDARRHVLEFDDVLNHQRSTIYKRRRKIVTGDNNILEADIYAVIERAGDESIRNVCETKKRELGDEAYFKTIRSLLLQAIDTFWLEHLEVMDYTRSSVNLRAYGQRDPLVEYKKEGLRLFRELEGSIDEYIMRLLPRMGGVKSDEQSNLSQGAVFRHPEGGLLSRSNKKTPPTSALRAVGGAKKVGRNEPCPCGSKKKYKHCHGK